MRYLVKIEELKDKVTFVEEHIDRIRDYVDNLRMAKSDVIWEGDAKDIFISKYDNYVTELNVMLKKLLKMVLYLKSYYISYDAAYNEMQNKYRELMNEVETK